MTRRAFIIGAGFSKPAGMPVATSLLPLLIGRLELEEMKDWLVDLQQRLAWLADKEPGQSELNIEEVFHHGHFDAEIHRLRQHVSTVGRIDGSGTPWNQAKAIDSWLSNLFDALKTEIFEGDEQANLEPIRRWAETVGEHDAILTFNYDTLAERALDAVGKRWNHATRCGADKGIPICKLHGSIDWIVADRRDSLTAQCDLLFDKVNLNRTEGPMGHVEEDFCLWRTKTRNQLRVWIEGGDVQLLPAGTIEREVGIAGLGTYKEVHRIPGLGRVWTDGMRRLFEADLALIVGFSMSEFDTMAKMQFAEVARARNCDGRPLPVVVIDPALTDEIQNRFYKVFRCVDFVKQKHEEFDWSSIG
jgi:hypothetical protein